MSTASFETVETANWVPIGSRQRRANSFSPVVLTRNREFESISLQRRVTCEPVLFLLTAVGQYFVDSTPEGAAYTAMTPTPPAANQS